MAREIGGICVVQLKNLKTVIQNLVSAKKYFNCPQQLRFGSFPFIAPPLSGCFLFASPDAFAIFLHNALPCNDTCSQTGGGGA